MILLLDTSDSICKISLIDGKWRYDDEWQADRQLAKGLLGYVDSKLKDNNKTWSDISALAVYEGPGSFTGLRIGLTVLNTVANANHIPIVGSRGQNWQAEAISKLAEGKDEKIVLPFYGSEARITKPRK
jgi:tRNA threonylcarbamoyladenosine biosynthesis protein TsaB